MPAPRQASGVRDGVLIVAGPTASGKTALAVRLAQRYGAEIVGADSRQVYRDMPIGTAAPGSHERGGVPHHLIGFLDPHERYSAARFVHDAAVALDGIAARGRRAIVVGGTGFYLRALAGGVALSPLHDDELRARLAREARTHPPEVLAEWLRALDPVRATALGVLDPYRVARALEVALAARAGAPPERAQPLPTLVARGTPALFVVLDVPAVDLDARIAARTDAMLAAGFVDEAERIGARAVAADAVGYREALAYLAGFATRPELRHLLARATRRYARRQATWFRGERSAVFVPLADAEARIAVLAEERLGWPNPSIR